MIKLIALAAILAQSVSSCSDTSADEKQNAMQEAITQQAVDAVGLPGISHFTEKRQLKQIYEKRDQNGPTYTYTYSEVTGKFSFLCRSYGYGIPYATQYTNPEHVINENGSLFVLPQADPNALYSPPSADGTWVYCVMPSKKIEPSYIEPKVSVFTEPLPGVPIPGESTR